MAIWHSVFRDDFLEQPVKRKSGNAFRRFIGGGKRTIPASRKDRLCREKLQLQGSIDPLSPELKMCDNVRHPQTRKWIVSGRVKVLNGWRKTRDVTICQLCRRLGKLR
jgi:hypothetical protein